jgi:hypothetical protein
LKYHLFLCLNIFQFITNKLFIKFFKEPGATSITDDYKHCDMCNRKYNQNAYDKHLPHCEKKNKENMFKNKGNPPNSQMGARNNNLNSKNTMQNNMNNMKPNLNTKFGNGRK